MGTLLINVFVHLLSFFFLQGLCVAERDSFSFKAGVVLLPPSLWFGTVSIAIIVHVVDRFVGYLRFLCFPGFIFLIPPLFSELLANPMNQELVFIQKDVIAPFFSM